MVCVTQCPSCRNDEETHIAAAILCNCMPSTALRRCRRFCLRLALGPRRIRSWLTCNDASWPPVEGSRTCQLGPFYWTTGPAMTRFPRGPLFLARPRALQKRLGRPEATPSVRKAEPATDPKNLFANDLQDSVHD